MTLVSDSPTVSRDLRLNILGSCAVFLVYAVARLTAQHLNAGTIYLADDAYYYLVIARNIVETGLSTFDGQTLTNGYHPLWLFVLAVQVAGFGSSVYLIVLIELVLAATGLWLFLASFRNNTVLFQITFTAAFTLLAWPMTARGMEVSLLIFCLGLFSNIAVRTVEGRSSAVALGLAAVLCIGARIDAAVFVIPILLLVCGSFRRAISALIPVASAGVLYAGTNLWVFGIPVPISGAIKSLGGLQVNQALFDQVAGYWTGPAPLRQTVSFLNSVIGRSLVLTTLAAFALGVTWRDRRTFSIGLGYLIGFAIFAFKIVALSSWVVWSWYGYPAILGLFVVFLAIDYHLSTIAFTLGRRRESAAAFLVLFAIAWQLHASATRSEHSFQDINLLAVAKFGPIFKHARVAMGDRAGSFAGHYPGHVTQLEGLVEDRTYLEALQHHQDIKPVLCARGVRYVLSYQRDLGFYETTTIPVLRSTLTHFPGPTLTFSRYDEIGRVFDLAKYDNTSMDVGNNYLYAWRLSGCSRITNENLSHLRTGEL